MAHVDSITPLVVLDIGDVTTKSSIAPAISPLARANGRDANANRPLACANGAPASSNGPRMTRMNRKNQDLFLSDQCQSGLGQRIRSGNRLRTGLVTSLEYQHFGAFWLSPNLCVSQKRRCFAAMRVMSCKHPACVFLPFKRDALATFADCPNQPILDK